MSLFAKSQSILSSLRAVTTREPVRRVPMLVEELEPRILHSADIGPALLHDGSATTQVESRVLDSSGEFSADAVESQQTRSLELVIVDTRTPDYQQLVDDMRLESADGRQTEVVLLDNRSNGLDQITALLAGRRDIGAVHIISHGSEGTVQLGGSVLDLQSLRAYAVEIESWANALTPDADLLIYGCDVAQSDAGRALIDALSRLTGADVAASENLTGNAKMGGDWNLEYSTGAIEAHLALSPQAQGEWFGLLAPVAAGGESQVNTTLGGNQTEANIAMASNGNFVAVWTADGNLDGNGKGIFAQRFDAGGNKLGGEVLVNTTTANDQTQASVAMDPNGNYVVVWTSAKQDPDGTDGVYGRLYNSSGLAQGGEFRVNGTTAGVQDTPAVAMDASGNFTVVWTSNQNGNLDVFARQYNAGGTPLGAEILVNATLAGGQSEAKLAMASSGSFVVVWTADGNLDGNGKGIFAQRFDAGGNKLGGEVLVNTTTANDQTQASVAMDPSGNYVVAWTSTNQDGDKGGIYAQRYDAAGAAQGSEFQVNSFTHDAQDSPSVAIDAAGRFTVTWQSTNQDGSNKGVYAQSYDAAGFKIGAEFRINTTTAGAQILPSIAMRGNGDFVVSWQGPSATDSSGVVAQRFASLNQAPANIVPGAQVAGGGAHVFSTTVGNAIQVTDADGGGALERVTLTATNGTLTLSQITGLSFSSGDGTADATMTFDGTLAAINAALDGMSFTATQSFSGAASVQIVSNDLGYTGAGGSLTDTDTVNITVASEGAPFIISGSYTGNGVDNRSITGVGFAPDVVIVKARDSNEIGVIRTSTMAADLTKELTGGTALVANEIQSFGANGFTVGTDTTVNEAGTTYDWIAFKTSPGFLTVGSYTGDGTAGRTVTGLGFSPDALFVFDAGNEEAVFTNSAAGGSAFDFDHSTNLSWITALGTDGFTVGTDQRVNEVGRTYHYIAWNEVPGLMDVGSYAGDSIDNRNIAGVGFQPEWVVVKNTAGDATVQHFDSQGAATDSSSFFTANSATTNRIQQLQADGFQVGADNDVNNSGRTYTYMAFRQETPPTISDVPNQVTNEDTATPAIAFTVGDAETAPGALSVLASSSNQTIVPDANILIGGAGASRTVTITPAPNQFGTVTITLTVGDGFATTTDTFVLTINPINGPPTVSAPATIGVNEDEASAVFGISFADSDAGGGNLQATFTVPQGTFSATSGGGVIVGGTATNLTLTGTLASINAFIAAGNIDYITALNDVSSVTLGVSINDLGNSGVGGPLSSAVSNVTLNVTAVNDAPEHAMPAAQNTAINTAVIFSSGSGNAISVSDVDAGSNPIEMTLSVSNGTLTLAGTIGLTFSVGSGTGDASMTFSGTIADINAALDGLRYDPTLAFIGSDGLNITSDDLGNSGNGGPKIVNDTAVINVAFVNSAPVLSGANDLGAIDEDGATNPGTLVSALITAPLQVSDANVGALSGIAVTAVDNTNGTWQYSTNGGSTWIDFGSPSVAAARLLAADADTFVRFAPDANFNGAIANGLTFRAWDRTSGAAGGTADTTSVANTISDTFSAVSYTNNDGTATWTAGWVDSEDGNPSGGNITVSGGQLVLSAPLGANDSITREANLSGATSATLSFSYSNSLALLGGTVSLQASNGGSYTTLATFSNGSNTGSGTFSTDVSTYISGTTRIQFVVNGGLLGGSMSVDDVQIAYVSPLNGGSSAFSTATASSSITVSAVNDAPTLSASASTAVTEDVASAITGISFGDIDAGSANVLATFSVPQGTLAAVSGGGVAVGGSATALTLTGSVANVNAFLAASNLTYTTALNDTSAVTLGICIDDQGNTGSGGALSATDNVTLNVTAVNDAPAGANNTVSTPEDTDYVFSSTDFGFTDPNDSPANALLAVKITTVPGAGTLSLSGAAVSAGQFVSDTDIAAGNLVFTPATNTNGTGYASFTFQVQDNGGGTDLDVTARTMTIDVTAVNDGPVLATNSGIAVNEGASATITAASLQVTDVDNTAAQLVFTVTTTPANGRLELTSAPGVPITSFTQYDIDNNLLLYVHGGSQTTSDSFSFVVSDGAGGSIGTTAFAISIAAIDDAPVNSVPGAQATNQDTALVFSTAGGNGISISDADAGAGTVQLSLSASNGTVTLATTAGLVFAIGTGGGDATMQFSGSIAAINTALDGLRFTPSAGFAGAAALSIVTDDLGNTGSGGPLTASSTVGINVTVAPVPPGTIPIIDPIPDPLLPPPTPVTAPGPPSPSTSVPNTVPVVSAIDEVPSAGGSVVPEAAPPADLETGSDRSLAYTLTAASTRNGGLVGASYVLPAAQWLMFGDESVVSITDGRESSFGLGATGDGRSALQSPALMDALDRLRDGLQEQSRTDALVVATTAAASVGLSVGYVLWLLRGGLLISTMLSSLPAWRLVDPLPILGRFDDEDDEDADDDSIESLIAANNTAPVAPAVPAEPEDTKSLAG